ncbi:MAG: nucleotide-binding universal stress UspA family protein [Cellvibrionaceae bacterium]|jgi:nucleotide-binding universal stress UspA family protein
MSEVIKTILYATDFSDNSSRVFQMELGLAKQYQAKLLFLHVVEPLSASLT